MFAREKSLGTATIRGKVASRVLQLAPIGLGLSLVAAGFLKGQELASTPSLPEGILYSKWLQILLIEGELFLGFWLLSSFYPHISRRLSLGCFAVFSVVSFAQAVAGSESCGCFGRMAVSPWYTLAFDVLALVGLWSWNPSATASQSSIRRWQFAAFACLSLLAGLPGAYRIAAFEPTTLNSEGVLVGASQVVVLHPADWVGKPLPLLAHIDKGEELATGRWVAVLYQTDCLACRDEVPYYDQLARQSKGQPGMPQVVFIEVPKVGSPPLVNIPDDSPALKARLKGEREWFVTTPAVLRLQDGKVLAVGNEKPAALATHRPKEPPQVPPPQSPGHATDNLPTLASTSPASTEEDSFSMPDFRRLRRIALLREIACGPLALIAVMESLGVNPSPEIKETLLAAGGSKGTDLKTLKSLAEAQGLAALGVQIEAKSLWKIKLPAICYQAEGSFAALVGFTENGVKVVFPLQNPRMLSADDFEQAFGKRPRMLFLSKDRIDPHALGIEDLGQKPKEYASCHLKLEKNVVGVGRIFANTWEASLSLQNDGSQPLHILGVQSSCGCMQGKVDGEVIPPGGATVLRIKGKQAFLGAFAYMILLESDQPDGKQVKIPVRGFLDCPVWPSKPILTWERILVGETVLAEILLDIEQDTRLQDLRVTIPKDASLTASFTGASAKGYALRLKWTGSTVPDWYHYKVDISSNAIPGGMTSSIEVAVEVLPSLDVFPHSLVLRDGEVSGAIRILTLRPNRSRLLNAPLALRWSDPSFEQVFEAAPPLWAADKATVHLTLKSDPKALLGRAADLIVASGKEQESRVRVQVGETRFADLPRSGKR